MFVIMWCYPPLGGLPRKSAWTLAVTSVHVEVPGRALDLQDATKRKRRNIEQPKHGIYLRFRWQVHNSSSHRPVLPRGGVIFNGVFS